MVNIQGENYLQAKDSSMRQRRMHSARSSMLFTCKENIVHPRFFTFGTILISHRLVIKAFQVTADHSFNSPEESRIKTTVVFEKKIFGRIFIKTFLFVKMITILARGCRDCQTGSDERRGDKPSNSTVKFFHSMNFS